MTSLPIRPVPATCTRVLARGLSLLAKAGTSRVE